jgi:hypothetical protein
MGPSQGVRRVECSAEGGRRWPGIKPELISAAIIVLIDELGTTQSAGHALIEGALRE